MIRPIRKEDRTVYMDMAKAFYSSKAVYHNIPEKHIADTFEELMRSDAYVAGYILEYENNVAGYALLFEIYSQESGGLVLWVDELYIRPEYRGCGLGHAFFACLEKSPHVKRIRLEVESGNERAISLYRRLGFVDLPYSQMMKDL